MPQHRDQRIEAKIRPFAPPATHEISPAPLRQEQQDQSRRSLTIREMANPSKRINGGRFQLEDRGNGQAPSSLNVYKMNPLDTMQLHQNARAQHATSTGLKETIRKNEGATRTAKEVTSKKPTAPSTTVFDDTASFDQSTFGDPMEDEGTVVLKPQKTNQDFEQTEMYARPHGENTMHEQHDMLARTPTDFFSGWQHEVDEERRVLQEKLVHTPQLKQSRGQGVQVEYRARYPHAQAPEHLEDPATPSRSRSAPPVNNVAPQKSVNFAASDQVMNLSPGFVSLEMERDGSFDQHMSRASSTQAHVRSASMHAKTQQPFRQPQNDVEQNHELLPNHGDRFRNLKQHAHIIREENPKVSAPESDNQDFSEDERAQPVQQTDRQKVLSDGTLQSSLPTKKRSYQEMHNGLDYSEDDLKQKKLFDLQAEPFPQDPRSTSQTPPRDNVSNNMALDQTLENLSKVSADAQRDTFRSLTDEQWANTGQWFVEKFQTELRKLMEVRLERRKVAMKYEDQIRRRQRVVEQHDTQLDKELRELQSGGKQLVDGRKVPTGSRSGTPMKGGR